MKECDQYSGLDLNPERTRILQHEAQQKASGKDTAKEEDEYMVTGEVNHKGEVVRVRKPREQQKQSLVTAAKHDPTQLFGTITGILLDTSESTKGKNGKNRIASPDLWEFTRLQGAGVLNVIEDENIQRLQQNLETELDEEVADVELNDKEAPFLKGQTTKAGLCLSPIKISKNPDGSL